MKTIFEHIEHVKGKPHHIRRRVAFGTATAITAIIALVWLAGSLGTGAFALKTTSFADITGGEGTLIVSGNDNEQLAGVGAASILPNAPEPARIEIIDAVTPESSAKKAEQTVIPF
ncbi:MAG: hypothetical protein Q7R59_00305 [bacterium]|nr:hypothetical protein [bacterium]